MVMPGWKTFLFFGIMAAVAAFRQFTGTEIPDDIATKLTEDQINVLIGHGQAIFDWVLIVGGFFFRAITKTPAFKK